jgi:hypothetical protein
VNFIGCDGPIVTPVIGINSRPDLPSCPSGWVVVTEQELLNQAPQNSLISREDFNVLSAWILTILIAAMGLRVVLKTLNIGARQHEKN